jgi:hypothetical protein
MDKHKVRVSRTERSIQLWDEKGRPIVLTEIVEIYETPLESSELPTEGKKPQSRIGQILKGILPNAVWDFIKTVSNYMWNFCRDLM